MEHSPALDFEHRFHPVVRAWFEKNLGQPTSTQREGWPPIAQGKNVLVCAPTGTGKTLTAFLYSLNSLLVQSLEGKLTEGTQVLYVTPLKALGNDIAINLQRPLQGIRACCEEMGVPVPSIRVGIRHGDVPPNERQAMLRHPPHLLITTPESLYLLLTGTASAKVLSTVRTVIVDELHALLDTKRGAQLSLSLERLADLCAEPPQRIGLSATIALPQAGASFLCGPKRPCVCVMPQDQKRVRVQVTAPKRVADEGTVWPELIRQTYEAARTRRSTLIFLNGRASAEKMAAGLCALAEDSGFARTHHGSMDKQLRLESEQLLKSGQLRCLCATASMELGIDVGEIDLVIQVGSPPTVAGGLQRMGRAGHAPGRVSEMRIAARTAADALDSALTAIEMLGKRVEPAHALPRCLDVLAQHLLSMTWNRSWTVEELLDLLRGSAGYEALTREELVGVLRMLSGEFERNRLEPVRPRLYYDAINDRVSGDAYTRMLACAASTIPDRGLFAVYLEDGVTRLGELDEEFVFEARIGDRFMLGAFSWQITRIERDRVLVRAVSTAGASIPFWRGDNIGRAYPVGQRFGAHMRALEAAMADGITAPELERLLPVDAEAARQIHCLLTDQLEAVGCLPHDRRIVLEHFTSESGNDCLMIHSPFGGRVHQAMSILLRDSLEREAERQIQAFPGDNGVLFVLIGGGTIPTQALNALRSDHLAENLLAILPSTPLFGMAYRYAAARAMMLGVYRGRRQPLWMQRQRGAASLELALQHPEHPMLQEALRECMTEHMDIPSLGSLLADIAQGRIQVVETRSDKPSPLTGELQMLFRGDAMYSYSPTPTTAQQSALLPGPSAELPLAALRPPDRAVLDAALPRQKINSADALHAFLLSGGDAYAEEMDVPMGWLEQLIADRRVAYVEPGLWIAAEHAAAYEAFNDTGEGLDAIVLRCLRYRGGMTASQLEARYARSMEACLERLSESGQTIERDGLWWHASVYRLAATRMRAQLRSQVETVPPAAFAAFLAARQLPPPGENRLEQALQPLLNLDLPAARWERDLLPARMPRYRPNQLDALLLSGSLAWRVTRAGEELFLRFERPGGAPAPQAVPDLDAAEAKVYGLLRERGAMFGHAVSLALGFEAREALLSLMAQGLAVNDSLAPLRALLMQAPRARQKLLAQAGRWSCAAPLPEATLEDRLEGVLSREGILCRETAALARVSWPEALDRLRIWEFTGRVRRGYFVKGLSGAQFVREAELSAVVAALAAPAKDLYVLPAQDPAQAWGRILPHEEQRRFVCAEGVCVVLARGQVVLVSERQGESLRWWGDPNDALQAFTQAFAAGRIYPGKPKLQTKEYPAGGEAALSAAGFQAEMKSFMLWRTRL